MKLNVTDAQTYYFMMEERDHAASRTKRISDFIKMAEGTNRTIVISLNVIDADYFEYLLNEDDSLTIEEADLCRRMVKEYRDYAAAKRAKETKPAVPELPKPIIQLEVLRYIPKGKHVAIRDCFKDGDLYRINLHEGWKAADGSRTLSAPKVHELKVMSRGITMA
jgi:hypothetical protein